MSVGYQLAGKRVELLRDIKPSLLRLAMLAQPDNTTARASFRIPRRSVAFWV